MAEPDYRTRARAGIGALQRWYDPASGLWRGTGWWNCANALTAVIRYTKLTGDGSHAGVISTTFTAAQRKHAGFVNHYYDDNGWWALAWVAAFDLTRDNRYLEVARAIFARNTAGWDWPRCSRNRLPWPASHLSNLSGYIRFFSGWIGATGWPGGLWCTNLTPKPRSTPVNGGALQLDAAYRELTGPVVPDGLGVAPVAWPGFQSWIQHPAGRPS